MKKYVMGLLILFAVTLLTVLSQSYTRSTVDRLQKDTDTMLTLIENEEFDACLSLLEETKSRFAKREPVMASYTSHLRLDEVTASLGRLKAYLKKESANDGMAEIYALQEKLDIILREEKITPENIL